MTPSVDTPLSPPPSERGPTYSAFEYITPDRLHQHLQPNAHKQGISVRISSQCGQPNQAQYGDCIVCCRTYEQIKKTAMLGYVESTTCHEERYDERQRRRISSLAGMDQGTVLFIPSGVLQADQISARRIYY